MKTRKRHSVTKGQVFLCEVFGISRKDMREYVGYNKQIHGLSIWKNLSFEKFEILCSIIEDEFELGQIKLQIFFQTLEEYRKQELLIKNKIKNQAYLKTEKGKMNAKKAQAKYRLKMKERRDKNGTNN